MSEPLQYRRPGTNLMSPAAYVTQTAAIFLDAYRDLQSKKLFWIVLGLSLLVGAALAAIGINPSGISILWWTLPAPGWNSNTVPPGTFYKYVFATYAVNLWLGLAATVLAIISTASIFPDFVSSGAVDLYLSRPLGRLRLFATKYFAGLTFATMQVVVFTLSAFLAVGLRGGVWEPGLFIAIPIVVLFFSFLFAVSTLVGVATRSAIAAILLTCLAWFLFFSINTAETTLLMFRRVAENEVQRQENGAKRMEKMLATTRNRDFEFQRDAALKGAEETKGTVAKLKLAHGILYAVKFPLPKTGETMDLLRRSLADYASIPSDSDDATDDDTTFAPPSTRPEDRRRRGRENGARLEKTAKEIADNRSIPYVLGTSLGFEVAVLALAALIFCKRDY